MKIGVQCLYCNEAMWGIMDYEIRKVCHPCGGYSLVDQSAAVDAARRRLATSETGDGWSSPGDGRAA